MKAERFVIFTGPWPGDGAPGARPGVALGDYIVCADGGYAICVDEGSLACADGGSAVCADRDDNARADGGSAVCADGDDNARADGGSAVCADGDDNARADGGSAVCADGDYIVCADGGYAICAAAGFRPAAVIGDFDSLAAELIDEIDALGIGRVIYPSDKDDTDTMLCVKYGLERGFNRFLIIGGIGGDFGHTMANLQVLSFLTDMKCEAEIMTGRERVLMADGEAGERAGGEAGEPDSEADERAGGETASPGGKTLPVDSGTVATCGETVPPGGKTLPVDSGTVATCGEIVPPGGEAAAPAPLVFTGRPGLRFSVLSFVERSSGVCIRNAKYELSDAVLTHSCPLGVSNECVNTDPVTVSVRYGRLLVIIDI